MVFFHDSINGLMLHKGRVRLDIKRNFFIEGGHALEGASEGSSGVSSSGGI